MDQGSKVVIIYHPSQKNQTQLKKSIAAAIGSETTPQQVILRSRPHGITAYVELPIKIAQSIVENKVLKVDNQNLNVKLFHCDHQIFINKLPSDINSIDVQEYFSKIGKVLNVIIEMSAATTYEARHCYIKFADNQDAENVLDYQKRHIIKNQEIKVHRTFGIGEGEQTDKKFFMKIEPKVEKAEEMEKNLQDLFKKFGKLREKIRIQETSGNSSKSTITFITHDAAEEAFKEMKEKTIGKYKVILRPFASDLAIYGIGLKAQVTEEEARKAFEAYGKVIQCKVVSKPGMKTVTVNYASEENAKLVLAFYFEYKEICALFNSNKPKLTNHMTTRERNEFMEYNKKGKKRDWNQPMQPFIPNFSNNMQSMQPMMNNQMYPPQNNMMINQPYMRNQPQVQFQPMNNQFSNQNNMIPPSTVGMGYSRQPPINKQ